jgi:hypothetical protein
VLQTYQKKKNFINTIEYLGGEHGFAQTDCMGRF